MSKYESYSSEQLIEHFSNFIIDSWSYSKVRAFSTNEKSFEMSYIYGCKQKRSASSAAGNAYHEALDFYFKNLAIGVPSDVIDMQQIAFNYIEDIPADDWKIQKTTPTVEECKLKAVKDSTVLINNFLSEIGVYVSEIEKVIGSEMRFNSWLTINGVDIPLPCHLVIDLIVQTKSGKTVVIDHKSKSKFTDEDEIRFSIGKQAITYALGYEKETGVKVDEVWFIENKISKNKDAGAQVVPFKCVLDSDTRRLYEAIIYEPLKRMIEAVSNPDYVYLINDSDNMVSKAEIYDFWAKTMIAEVDDFNVPDNKKTMVQARLRKIRDASIATVNPTVIKNFKKFTEQFIPFDFTNKNMTNQEKIEHVLRSFGIIAKVQYTFEGYSSSSYLLELNAGVQISQVSKYRLDIANALNVANVRVQKDLYVYEGKSYLAIESGKKGTGILYWDKKYINGGKIPLGLDNFGNTIVWDTTNHSTPHMLICGATGSGKSVEIRSIIEYGKHVFNDIVIFDPKYEFTKLKGFARVYNDIEEIEEQMKLLVEDMQGRVKNGTNKKTLVIFDEFADAVANSRKGSELKKYQLEEVGIFKNGTPKTQRVCMGEDKSLEENLRILLQKGRSSGFRIIAATQRASTKVITGDAKVNFPVQICFRVPKDVDSMVVIDEPGAEALNGRGDGLIKSPEYFGVTRFQAFYIPE